MLILQSRQATMGEMIGNIAHQWRQPINLLSILLQSINFKFKKGVLDQKALEHYVQNGLDSIQYMSQTIDDFRNYFKPSEDKKEFSVKSILQKTIELVEYDLQNNAITLTVNDFQDYRVCGYSNEFGQVLLNLIHNSKDALLNHPVENRNIVITVAATEGHISIQVKDNGGGIPSDIIDKVFDPYFTTKKDGTGIGLYMSKMLIEKQMAGKLTVNNTKDGTEFTITLTQAGVSYE